jgi:hypothetical protein
MEREALAMDNEEELGYQDGRRSRGSVRSQMGTPGSRAILMKRIIGAILGMIVSYSIPTMALASPTSALMQSLYNLKAAITTKLDLDNGNCQRGSRDACQNALLDNVQLNIVNSEIALRKLARTVRSSGETRELIDDAIDKLSDVDTAVSEIEEKLDE